MRLYSWHTHSADLWNGQSLISCVRHSQGSTRGRKDPAAGTGCIPFFGPDFRGYLRQWDVCARKGKAFTPCMGFPAPASAWATLNQQSVLELLFLSLKNESSRLFAWVFCRDKFWIYFNAYHLPWMFMSVTNGSYECCNSDLLAIDLKVRTRLYLSFLPLNT